MRYYSFRHERYGEEDEAVDFDYSGGNRDTPRDSNAVEKRQIGQQNAGGGRSIISHSSSELENESRRLDKLVHIFAAGSMSTTSSGAIREKGVEVSPAAAGVPRSRAMNDARRKRNIIPIEEYRSSFGSVMDRNEDNDRWNDEHDLRALPEQGKIG